MLGNNHHTLKRSFDERNYLPPVHHVCGADAATCHVCSAGDPVPARVEQLVPAAALLLQPGSRGPRRRRVPRGRSVVLCARARLSEGRLADAPADAAGVVRRERPAAQSGAGPAHGHSGLQRVDKHHWLVSRLLGRHRHHARHRRAQVRRCRVIRSKQCSRCRITQETG